VVLWRSCGQFADTFRVIEVFLERRTKDGAAGGTGRVQVSSAKEAALHRRIAELEAEVRRLSEIIAGLSKNSSNSSKPPSSDIVKPPKASKSKSRRKKRKIGGQPGHAKHEREPFTPDEIDRVVEYEVNCCPCCGGGVRPRPSQARVVQQVEIISKPVEIIEHRAEGGWCNRCQRVVYADMPAPVERGGLLGPEITALVGYLKGVCHASFSTIRKFFRDVLKIRISRGQLAKVIQKVSAALAPAYEALGAAVALEPVLNVDETGHKENGKRLWTWCFRAKLYTLFKIDPSRGSDVLGAEFDGVLGCDYFSAYRKYMREFSVELQFCLAHFIREVKFIQTLPGKRERIYAERVLDALRDLFTLIHRRDKMTESRFQTAMQEARDNVIDAVRWVPPRCKQARNLAERLEKHGDAYFRFITTPGVEPTNNLAEQAIRFCVIDRKITQGTRGEPGRRWCERIWTVMATCAQQGRSVFHYLRDAVQAFFNNQLIPTLNPAGP
jgi:transposase